jgi:hypothetical protein
MPTQLIYKGQTNWLYFTVQELSTSDSPIYKFVFTHDQEKVANEVYLTDVSDYKESYNLFQLIEGTTLTFSRAGDWEYKAYDANNNQVEIGKIIVVPAGQVPKFAPSYKNENNFVAS